MMFGSITSGAPSAGSSNGPVLVFYASLSTLTVHGGSIGGCGICSIADGVSPQSGLKRLSSASTRRTGAYSGSMGAGSSLEGLSVGSQWRCRCFLDLNRIGHIVRDPRRIDWH
jgi:hypothetical protein